jgi:NADH dehydrogenase
MVDGGGGRPRVVVVGGGFAGLSAVRELSGADVDVLLLDDDLYNTFQPLLYQVATGGLNPGDVTYALRAFAARFGNARFRRVRVSGLDAARRCVRTEHQRGHRVRLPGGVLRGGRQLFRHPRG